MVFFHWFWKHNCFLPRIYNTKYMIEKKTLRSMQGIFHLNVYDSIRCLLWHTIEIEHHIFIGSVYHLEIFTATPFQIGIGTASPKSTITYTQPCNPQTNEVTNFTHTFILKWSNQHHDKVLFYFYSAPLQPKWHIGDLCNIYDIFVINKTKAWKKKWRKVRKITHKSCRIVSISFFELIYYSNCATENIDSCLH